MMNNGCVAVSCLALALCLLEGPTIAGDGRAEAVQAAESWLALVDAGEYQESWNQAAEYFKQAVTQDLLSTPDHKARALFPVAA